MTIAAQLPKTILDIRGDRLRFELANALNECEAQYRRGKTDKSTSLAALLSAVQTKLSGMATVGSVTIAAISTDDKITDAEAASPVTVAITFTNVANGVQPTVLVDGAVLAGVTIGTVSAGAATVTMTAAAAAALAKTSHILTVSVVDSAALLRTATRTFTRATS